MTFLTQSPGISPVEVCLPREQEEELLEPEVCRSAKRVSRLLAEECIALESSGRVFDNRLTIEALQQGMPRSTHRVSLREFTVRRIVPTTMLVAYLAAARINAGRVCEAQTGN
jgi:hypothetical protein